MKRFMLFIIKLFSILIYFISYLFPRKKNRWLFGEAHGFNNNSKYLFLEIIESHPEITAIWIGNKKTVNELKSMGLPTCWRYSIYGIYLCLTSKVYVVSWTTADINFYLSGGALIVNLWHGTPIKKCLWLEPKNIEKETSCFLMRQIYKVESPFAFWGNILVASPSEFYTDIISKMFKVEKDRCIEDIYPRVKFMMKSKNEIRNYLIKYGFLNEIALLDNLKSYNKIFIYAPTFRDNGMDFIENSGLDFHYLDELLIKNNCCLIVKFHPATRYDNKKYNSLKNVIFLNNQYDLYTIMPFSDILISDYSSIMFDYMILNKRIIAFVFDYDIYVANCRELLFDLNESIDGIPMAHNTSELVNLMFAGYDTLPSISPKLYDRYWEPSGDLITTIKERL